MSYLNLLKINVTILKLKSLLDMWQITIKFWFNDELKIYINFEKTQIRDKFFL